MAVTTINQCWVVLFSVLVLLLLVLEKGRVKFPSVVTAAAEDDDADAESEWTLSWNAPFLSSPSGYGSEATSFMNGLKEQLQLLSEEASESSSTETPGISWKLAAGLTHGDLANPSYWRSLEEDESSQVQFFRELDFNQGNLDPSKSIIVCHSEPGAWSVPTPLYQSPQSCPPAVSLRTITTTTTASSTKYQKLIGRTMFETDRLPKDWYRRLNQMDELWVPTQFMKNVMQEGGVTQDIHVVGQGIDVTQKWNPTQYSKFSTQEWETLFRRRGRHTISSSSSSPDDGGCQANDFKFLSVFKWEKRKAPEILLHSFWNAFGSSREGLAARAEGSSGVCLILVTSAYNDDPQKIPNEIHQQWEQYLQLKRGDKQGSFSSSVTLLSDLSGQLLSRLYANVQAFVLPSRGEGWGRPYMEAMAMGLPVIATNWSGPTEFITPETGYLLPIHPTLVDAHLDAFPGHRWAEPNAEELTKLLKTVFERYEEEAQHVGRRARNHIVANWSNAAVARDVLFHLKRLVGGAAAAAVADNKMASTKTTRQREEQDDEL